jgi:4-hydroxy-tetrahydrodipicolinate synthase
MGLNLKGTGVAIVTPFNSNKEIDYNAYENLVNFIIENKVEYIVVLGTTGESVTLSIEEKKKLVDFTVEKVNKRVPVVLGLGGNDTQEVIAGFKKYNFTGIDAILSVSPYYNKPTQEGIYQHYKAISEASPVPIILYNVPGRTASNITASTTIRLANDFKNIIAVKEASGNMEQCMEIIDATKNDEFYVISGDDALTLPFIASGGDGVISVVANAFPKDFSDMVRAALKDDMKTARELHYKVLPIISMLFAEGNPAGIKAALKVKNITPDTLRLPLVNVSDALFEKIKIETLRIG